MRWTKLRERTAATITLLFLILVAAIMAAAFGIPIPVVSDLLRNMGII